MRIIIGDGSSWPTPEHSADVADVLRYGSARDRDAVAVRAAAIIDAYLHLVAHPSGSVRAQGKIAAIRRALVRAWKEAHCG